MGAGRPTKPYALRLLEGDTTKRSKEFNKRYENEIEIEGEFPVDQPPEWLTDEGKAEWERLAGILARSGLLKATDYQMFANYCQAAGEVAYLEGQFVKERAYLVEDPKGRIMVNPAMRILSQRKQELMSIAKEFGFTPSMRARLSVLSTVKKEEDENSMASLLSRRPG